MKTLASDALRGTAIAAAASAASWTLAEFGFRRDWYLGVLVPAAALVCLLLAWLIHLREDGFARGGRSGTAAGRPVSSARDEAADRPRPEEASAEVPGRPDLGLFAPRDGLVERSSAEGPREGGGRRAARPGGMRRALVWAAVEMALLSIALYEIAGIGAHFFE